MYERQRRQDNTLDRIRVRHLMRITITSFLSFFLYLSNMADRWPPRGRCFTHSRAFDLISLFILRSDLSVYQQYFMTVAPAEGFMGDVSATQRLLSSRKGSGVCPRFNHSMSQARLQSLTLLHIQLSS